MCDAGGLSADIRHIYTSFVCLGCLEHIRTTSKPFMINRPPLPTRPQVSTVKPNSTRKLENNA